MLTSLPSSSGSSHRSAHSSASGSSHAGHQSSISEEGVSRGESLGDPGDRGPGSSAGVAVECPHGRLVFRQILGECGQRARVSGCWALGVETSASAGRSRLEETVEEACFLFLRAKRQLLGPGGVQVRCAHPVWPECVCVAQVRGCGSVRRNATMRHW